MSIDQEPRFKHHNIRNAVLATMSVLGVGGISIAAVYGAIEAGLNVRWWFRGSINVPPRPEAPVLPTMQNGSRSTDIDRNLQGLLRQSLTTYKDWQSYAQFILQPLLNTSQPKQVWELLERSSKNFITEGVNALQTSWILGYSRDLVQMNQSGQDLWINGEHFDLGSRYERQLAASWMQTRVLMLDRSIDRDIIKGQGKLERFKDEEISQQELEFGEDLDSLMWLKRRQALIEMSEESFAFFPREEMVKTARIVKAVDQFGFDLHRGTEWCSSVCLNWRDRKEKMMNEEGEIKEVDFSAGGTVLSNDEVKLENLMRAEDFAHELGHLVSYQNIGQLLQEFESLRGYSGQARSEDRLSHISLYATWKTGEDFAETFEAYLMDGENFRLLLQELRFHNPTTWAVLQSKYDFMKDRIFGNLEYGKEARVRAQYFEEREQEFAGLNWSAQNHSLEVRPNPKIWPGKRSLSKRYPVLADGRIRFIQVNFAYNPKENSYNIDIPHSLDLISGITLYPFEEDAQIMWENGDAKSLQVASMLGIPSTSAQTFNIQLRILSIPPVQNNN